MKKEKFKFIYYEKKWHKKQFLERLISRIDIWCLSIYLLQKGNNLELVEISFNNSSTTIVQYWSKSGSGEPLKSRHFVPGQVPLIILVIFLMLVPQKLIAFPIGGNVNEASNIVSRLFFDLFFDHESVI